ncbi:hypothetical protein SNEBB_010544 [Seison nebaliae]|nr:hypothetical protein SNEBB_010544 [Seison nebaliae]
MNQKRTDRCKHGCGPVNLSDLSVQARQTSLEEPGGSDSSSGHILEPDFLFRRQSELNEEKTNTNNVDNNKENELNIYNNLTLALPIAPKPISIPISGLKKNLVCSCSRLKENDRSTTKPSCTIQNEQAIEHGYPLSSYRNDEASFMLGKSEASTSTTGLRRVIISDVRPTDSYSYWAEKSRSQGTFRERSPYERHMKKRSSKTSIRKSPSNHSAMKKKSENFRNYSRPEKTNKGILAKRPSKKSMKTTKSKQSSLKGGKGKNSRSTTKVSKKTSRSKKTKGSKRTGKSKRTKPAKKGRKNQNGSKKRHKRKNGK